MSESKPYQEGDHIRDFIDFALSSADDAGPRGDDAKDALAELERLLWFVKNVKAVDVQAAKAEAWSEGYGVGKGDGMKGVKTGRMFQNPYRVTPTRDEAIDAASRKDPLEE